MPQSLGGVKSLLRADHKAGFAFSWSAATTYPACVRFTDDAGLHWEIDKDLHLRKFDHRDW